MRGRDSSTVHQKRTRRRSEVLSWALLFRVILSQMKDPGMPSFSGEGLRIRKAVSREARWGEEAEMFGTKKFVEKMTSNDGEMRELFDAVIRDFVRDTIRLGNVNAEAVRELLAHQKDALVEVYEVLLKNEKGKKMPMSVYAHLIAENHYWIPGATLVYLEAQFNQPVIGEKPFVKKDGLNEEPNNKYLISEKEQEYLLTALNELIEKYDETLTALHKNSTLELTQKINDADLASDTIQEEGEERKSA
jgi:hypothetical protein